MSDYISREAAIELLHYNADERCSAVVSDFEAIPAADVEPVVRANWQFLSGSPGTVRCSNCGAEFEDNPYAKYKGKWIGCPACRAKMQMIMDLEVENDG